MCLKHQFSVIILRVLFKHCSHYSDHASDPDLQPIPRRVLAVDGKTKQFPLRTTTIEEASIQRNLTVHGDAYLNQLGCEAKDLVHHMIPSINDQSTNARIHGGQVLCINDLDPWT